MNFSVFIVEDEEISLQALKQMVEAVPWLNCVGEAASYKHALNSIAKLAPDVLFLDIRIQGGNGLKLLENCKATPHVIFTTAYSRYAVTAFDKDAVDYLLKPFSQKRFDVAIEKLRVRLFGATDFPEQDGDKIFVKSGNRLLPVTLSDVDYFTACRNYVVAVSGRDERVLNTSLSALHAQLNPEEFIRVHRSHIVNRRLIRSMSTYKDRQLKLILRNNAEIFTSRSGAARLRDLLLSPSEVSGA